MAGLVPYQEPRRGFFNSKTVVYKLAKGAYVYSPVRGKVYAAQGGLIVVTETGSRHIISNVVAKVTGSVCAGDFIGRALGKKVTYKKFVHEEQADAMVVVKRKSKNIPKRWLPRAEKYFANGTAGIMGPGNEHCVVWHTSESGTDKSAIYGVASWVRQQQSEYHLIWNPYTGQFVQLFPANVGSRAMLNDGSYPVNRHGRIRIQVCVVGRAANAPLKNSPMRGRRELMAWLDSWGVPRERTIDKSRSRSSWEESGHTTHSSAPGNDHTDPGRIDFNRLFAP